MAVIHKTTMNPTKVELLAAWLPRQPWFIGAGNEPRLTRTGGFRLDDPAGEVGIEFLAGTDHSTGQPVTYLMPMTYRGEPLPDGDADAVAPNADELTFVEPGWLETAITIPRVRPNATGMARGIAMRAARLRCVRRRITGRCPVSIQSTSVSAVTLPTDYVRPARRPHTGLWESFSSPRFRLFSERNVAKFLRA